MADRIDDTARQVRSTVRGSRGVHRLLATVKVPDGGGRAYKTACHREISTQHATLTTKSANCEKCERETK